MLAELAAINAAYGVIKEVVGNGRELHECGAQLYAFFDGKSALQKKINSTPLDQRGQLEEFFALEKIKQQEEELRQLMQWNGRPGLWDDWLQYQAQAARARREEIAKAEREALQRRQRIEHVAEVMGITFVVVAVATVLILGIIFIALSN